MKALKVALILGVLLAVGCQAPITERSIPLSSAVTAGIPENYKLVPNDIVRIDVFQEVDMLTEQRIAQDGSIYFPLIGRTLIAGQSLEGAANLIGSRLKDGFLVDPQVTVTIVAYAPRRITILGQVNGAGSYEIPSEEVILLPSAIALAGGNTRIGNLRRILVTRIRDDSMKEIVVNMLTPEGRQFVVEPDDVITIPESLF